MAVACHCSPHSHHLLTVVATSSEAIAQQPGESSFFTVELVGDQGLETRNDRAEARNGGNLLEVWRGFNNNTVWMSLNNGRPFQTVNPTSTQVAPTVVPWGNEDFMVFHTGTNGIYFTFVFSQAIEGTNEHTLGEWEVVPGQTTQMPVSVAQLGAGSTNVYMVYRGFGNDTRIFGTWYNGRDWSQPVNINGGRASSGPTITLVPEIPASAENPIPFANRLIVTAVGTDNNIWSTGQVVGADNWSPWTPILGQATGPNANHNLANNRTVAQGAQVYTAVNENTNGTQTLVMDVLDSNRNPEYTTFNLGVPQLSELTNWTVDLSGFQANETPELTSNGNSTYSLITGLDDLAYWKQEFHQ
jgi:hypothetical protein